MRTKRSQEGYFMLANQHAPADPSLPVGLQAPLVEAPAITCSHCQRIVVLNPMRTRARPYCPKCDHYVCDACEALRVASGGECRPFVKLLDLAAERLERGLPIEDLLP